MRGHKHFKTIIKNIIFGVEDSLVSSVGMLSGIAYAGVGRTEIIIAGVILIFVEAFSMGVGSSLTEHITGDGEHEDARESALVSGVTMFSSYFIAGFIPLSPYILLPLQYAPYVSITAALLGLFIAGSTAAKILRTGSLKAGFRFLILGGLAIGIGVLVGTFLRNLNIGS
ncbi:MAG TPA: VIT1/CCC1 transporter family protein [Patescibacteria group bacterium]|nr:VIT1/CCC1 transporter family protein [Patescibacteria group bacterium]